MKKPRKSKPSTGRSEDALKRRTPLSTFARGLLREWRRLGLLRTGETVIVGVSGGADSVALFLALDELVRAGKVNVEIVVAHLNHKLRGANSDADADWVRVLVKRFGHRSVIKSADIKQRALTFRDNLEQAARLARYEFFAAVARKRNARLVLTAHTMNDQAETILLNLIRGSGSDGLGGIAPCRPLVNGSEVVLARPLLSWARRQDTEDFCRRRLIDFREDEMNLDEAFTRVRVRKELLPLLEKFNRKFVENTVRNAEVLRADNAALDLAAAALLHFDENSGRALPVRTAALRAAPAALRRRALRLWLAHHRGDLRRIEHTHIIAIEKLLLSTKSGRAIELPAGATAVRQDGMLHYRPRRRSK